MNDINEPQRHLDLGQAVVFLEKAVAEKGEDYVYQVGALNAAEFAKEHPGSTMSCLYFHEEAPSCIVGHVLSYMGHEADAITEHENARNELEILAIDADEEVKALLCDVQERQDHGAPWGEAVRQAKEARGL